MKGHVLFRGISVMMSANSLLVYIRLVDDGDNGNVIKIIHALVGNQSFILKYPVLLNEYRVF